MINFFRISFLLLFGLCNTCFAMKQDTNESSDGVSIQLLMDGDVFRGCLMIIEWMSLKQSMCGIFDYFKLIEAHSIDVSSSLITTHLIGKPSSPSLGWGSVYTGDQGTIVLSKD